MIKKGIKTTIIGIIAIIGLAYKIYLEGGLSVEDFLILITAIGFLFTKDSNASHTFDTIPDNPPPDDDDDDVNPG
jgi:hypothetical protein